MSTKVKITPKMVRAAVAKIRRRTGINEDGDITVTMIAKEVGCSRNALYQKDLKKVIAPFQKIKKKDEGHGPAHGSIEYYKDRVKRGDAEKEQLQERLNKAKDKVIDFSVLKDNLEKQKEVNTKLRDSIKDDECIKKIEELEAEVKRLRDQIMRSGLRK